MWNYFHFHFTKIPSADTKKTLKNQCLTKIELYKY